MYADSFGIRWPLRAPRRNGPHPSQNSHPCRDSKSDAALDAAHFLKRLAVRFSHLVLCPARTPIIASVSTPKTMNKPAIEICVYCGGNQNLTDEHGPPKLIFPEPRPSNLITVRACTKCNIAGSKDAEYFRQCLCLNRETRNSPTAQAAKQSVFRSLNRTEAVKFKVAFLSGLALDKSGISFSVEIKRLHSVVERTVQCLYLHETGQRIPETHEVIAIGEDSMKQLKPDRIRRLQENFMLPLAELDPKIIGGDAFAYAVIHTGRAFVSAWGLLFYGSVPFIALTTTRKRPLFTSS